MKKCIRCSKTYTLFASLKGWQCIDCLKPEDIADIGARLAHTVYCTIRDNNRKSGSSVVYDAITSNDLKEGPKRA